MPSAMPDPAPGQSLPLGTRLEEFVVERVLGSGGFGITYLAEDARLGRKVVVKENLPVQFAYRDSRTLRVRPRHSQGEEAELFAWSLESFEREAAMLASLDHPGIVRVLRSFEANGTAYFAMPYVEGRSLRELIDGSGRHADGHASCDQLVILLDALEYLHDRGIYHRDIKPENILITNEGRPVLIDFGAARQRLSDRSLTVIESPGYTPFEQLETRGQLGPWSDLYSLGATFYRVLTGETPPKAADRVFGDPIVPLHNRNGLASRYRSAFLSSIDQALAIRPEDRWQDAADWRGALWADAEAGQAVGSDGAGVSGAPLESGPQKLERATGERASGSKMRVSWLAGLAAVAVAAAVVVFSIGGRKQIGKDGPEAPEQERADASSPDNRAIVGDPTPNPDARRNGSLIGGVSLDPSVPEPADFSGGSGSSNPSSEQGSGEPDPMTAAERGSYQPPESFPAPGPRDGPLGKTHDLLAAFLRAPDLETRLRYSYQGESLRAAMGEYHRERPFVSADRFSKKLFQMDDNPDTGGPYWVFLISSSDAEEGFPVIIRVEDGLLKVDWEIYSEFQDRHFGQFLSSSIGSSGTFRLVLDRKSRYYGPDQDTFPGLDRYLVYQVNPPYGDVDEYSKYAFVEKDTDLARRLDAAVGLGDDPLAVILTLEVRTFPHGAKHFVISDYVTEGWFR